MMSMAPAPAFANPLTERLAAFARGIGIDVRAATLVKPTAYGMSCEPHRAAKKGLPPFPHMRRWMR
ncbi:MAG: hypothetical protein WBC94_16030 [Xanthobacteraceae bacterium]